MNRSRAAVRFDAAVLVNHDPESGLTAACSLAFFMGVREVWRHDGDRLAMLAIGDGGYRPIESSIGPPGLSATRIDAFLARRFEPVKTLGETALITEFREAVAAGLDT